MAGVFPQMQVTGLELTAGGMAAVQNGTWKAADPSITKRTTAADLNAKALETPEKIPGLTTSTKEAIEKVEASAKVLGFSVFST